MTVPLHGVSRRAGPRIHRGRLSHVFQESADRLAGDGFLLSCGQRLPRCPEQGLGLDPVALDPAARGLEVQFPGSASEAGESRRSAVALQRVLCVTQDLILVD